MRSCGGCTLCCKLIQVPELSKPSGSWCRHCNKGRGCRVFATEELPSACREFRCAWLDDESMNPALRPDRCRVIFERVDDYTVAGTVDPHRPGAWSRSPLREVLGRLTREGISAVFYDGLRTDIVATEGRSRESVRQSLVRFLETRP